MNIEDMAERLGSHPDYRVLRRLDPTRLLFADPTQDARTALFVDVETTGLDWTQDEVIEIAAIPFTYGPDGRIYALGEPFHGFRDPGRPIPPKITTLTGITDEMVQGCSIDVESLEMIAKSASPIISHNARFDRPFCESLTPVFAELPWTCSMSQIDWNSEGYSSRGLEYLAMKTGFFYDAHRSTDDCMAGIAMLATRLPVSGVPTLFALLECGRRPSYLIWAEGSPFEAKDILKDRGYLWHQGRRCWHIEVEDGEAESTWLRENIYRRNVDLPMQRITAFDRFSSRLIGGP